MILVAGVAVLATSRRNLLRMHDACNKSKQRLEGEEPDQTDQETDQRETPKKQKKQRKGLGANQGHKESQFSHSPSTNAFRSFSLAPAGSDRRSSLAIVPSRG